MEAEMDVTEKIEIQQQIDRFLEDLKKLDEMDISGLEVPQEDIPSMVLNVTLDTSNDLIKRDTINMISQDIMLSTSFGMHPDTTRNDAFL